MYDCPAGASEGSTGACLGGDFASTLLMGGEVAPTVRTMRMELKRTFGVRTFARCNVIRRWVVVVVIIFLRARQYKFPPTRHEHSRVA